MASFQVEHVLPPYVTGTVLEKFVLRFGWWRRVQENCGTNVLEEHSTAILRFDAIGVKTHIGKVIELWSLKSRGWGSGICRVEVHKKDWTWNNEKTFLNDRVGWERIVRKFSPDGPLRRLMKEMRALMYKSSAHVC
jgi:hypothetical protein